MEPSASRYPAGGKLHAPGPWGNACRGWGLPRLFFSLGSLRRAASGLWGAGNRGSAAILTAGFPQPNSGCKGRIHEKVKNSMCVLLQQGGGSPAALFPGDINHLSAVSGFTLVQQMCKAPWEHTAEWRTVSTGAVSRGRGLQLRPQMDL